MENFIFRLIGIPHFIKYVMYIFDRLREIYTRSIWGGDTLK